MLAVDGGNSKTHLALVAADGELRSLVRGPLSSPHHLGVDGCLGVLEQLFDEAVEQAGIVRDGSPVAAIGKLLLAGVDFPSEELELQTLASPRGWAEHLSVGNDTVALLRAGTERGWGVAVVCGAGINCIGVAPDGRQARFPALGEITGDWGGGYDVGMAAVSAAARSEDGRGPRTSLEQAVPAHFGLTTPTELAYAFHVQRIPRRSVLELAPLVFAEADGDDVAAGIVDRLAEEVVALARAALARLELTTEPVEVVLGGGLLKNAHGRLLDRISAGLADVGSGIEVHPTSSAPVVGAALLGLDELGADAAAQARARRELTEAVERAQPAAAITIAAPRRPSDG
ncbi:MAG: ATPase [Thermoleophilia bacterium]|nr:ATPase [Thermoleophilia bacterium]